MTIDSVPITKNAVYSESNVRIPSATTSGAVPVYVRAHEHTNKHVSAGIPFPKGAIASTQEMNLTTANGTPVPAQFDILAYYPDGSIKVALVSAYVTGSATEDTVYSVQYGPQVSRLQYSSNLSYTETLSEFVVTTGKARITLDKLSGALIKSAYVDSAGDQSYSTQVLGTSNVYLQDAHTDTVYNSSASQTPVWEVIHSGPMMLHLRVSVNPTDALGNILTELRQSFIFYRDSGEINYDITLIDNTVDDENKDTFTYGNPVEFALRNYGIDLNHTINSQRYIFGGADGNHAEGVLNNDEYLYQHGEFPQMAVGSSVYITKDPNLTDNQFEACTQDYSGVISGSRAPGFCTIHNGTQGVSFIVRKFWQQWPKELSLSSSSMQIGLHPERYHGGNPTVIHEFPSGEPQRFPNTMYNPKRGMAKTYHCKIILHEATPQASHINKVAAFMNWPGIPLECSPATYCSSGAFKVTDPSNSMSVAFDTSLRDDQLYRSINGLSDINHGPKFVVYNWRDYGDRMRPGSGLASHVSGSSQRMNQFYNGTHIGAHTHITHWMRTGHREWFEVGERETRQCMDINYSHCYRTRDWGPVGSAWERMPPGELRIRTHAVFDHDSGNSHAGHAHLSGIVELYLLTGDIRCKEFLEQQKAYWEVRRDWEYRIPRQVERGVSGPTTLAQEGQRPLSSELRVFGWPMFCMTAVAKTLNDRQFFATTVSDMMDFMVQWWKTPGIHEILGVVKGSYDYTQGTGMWWMDRMDNAGPPYGSGTSAWYSPSVFYSIIEYLELDEDFRVNRFDHAELRMMMYQCMNNILKFNWDNDNQDLWYSEARQGIIGSGDADKQVASVASKIFLMYQEDLAAGNISNPEWFDFTYWHQCIQFYINKSSTQGNGIRSTGLYGYDIPWPMETWRWFREYNEYIAANPTS